MMCYAHQDASGQAGHAHRVVAGQVRHAHQVTVGLTGHARLALSRGKRRDLLNERKGQHNDCSSHLSRTYAEQTNDKPQGTHTGKCALNWAETCPERPSTYMPPEAPRPHLRVCRVGLQASLAQMRNRLDTEDWMPARLIGPQRAAGEGRLRTFPFSSLQKGTAR